MNVTLGVRAGDTLDLGQRNVFIGEGAGKTSENVHNVYLGYQAGQNASGANNIFIGPGCMQNETS